MKTLDEFIKETEETIAVEIQRYILNKIDYEVNKYRLELRKKYAGLLANAFSIKAMETDGITAFTINIDNKKE